jgi:hypothetical protein
MADEPFGPDCGCIDDSCSRTRHSNARRSERFLPEVEFANMRKKRQGTSPRSRKLIEDTMPMHGHSDRTDSRQGLVGGEDGSLRDVERAYVQRVLATSATLKEAARRLGIDMATLWRMRKRWGLA